MYSPKTENYFIKNGQYKTVPQNDVFVPCRFLSRDLTGICDQMARHIEKIQLLDTKKWKQFTDIFADENADGDNNGWKGEYWGKLMRGAAITYGYTKNPKLYSVMENTVKDMLETQDELGRFSTYSVDKEYHGWDIWARKYVLLGMLHFCEICKDEALKEQIISALKKHLDYILNTISDDKIPINQTSDAWGCVNSVSILEPVILMYNLTGEKRYLDFADYIVKTGPQEIDIFTLAYEDEKAPYEWSIRKAYELMSCFEGLIEYYRVTGIEKWKTAAINIAERIMKTDVTVIGCCGCEGELFDHSAATQTDPDNPHDSMQETCVTITWMKLCYQLLRLTGDSKYADQIERSVYNALYGSVNSECCTHNHGLPFDSYSPLIMRKRATLVGGQQYDKDNHLIYGCCAAIGAAGTGLVPEIAASLSEDGIALNLYISGEYNLITPSDNPVKISVDTEYPKCGTVNIKVLPEKKEEFTLMLRIPSFSEKTELAVNGESVGVNKGYTAIRKTWESGDTVTLKIDMNPHIIHAVGCFDKESTKHYIAVEYGPIVLARDARMGGSGQAVDLLYNADGSIDLIPSNDIPFKTFCEFKAPLKDGGYITLIDYQSAGKTWDDDSVTEAWLPTK